MKCNLIWFNVPLLARTKATAKVSTWTVKLACLESMTSLRLRREKWLHQIQAKCCELKVGLLYLNALSCLFICDVQYFTQFFLFLTEPLLWKPIKKIHSSVFKLNHNNIAYYMLQQNYEKYSSTNTTFFLHSYHFVVFTARSLIEHMILFCASIHYSKFNVTYSSPPLYAKTILRG